ncbi:MAG: IclR family transcriptional regulator [Ilumatobacteraceae bacterium]
MSPVASAGTGTGTGTGKKAALQSVGIALAVLDALAAAPELSLSELARRVGVAKSTAHRTCAVLTDAGMLTRTEGGRYRLGLRLIEYGHLATARSPVGEHALPLLVELRSALGETVQIGVPAGPDVVYVERVEGNRALRYSTDNSRRGPIHRSSAGKVLAAFVPGLLDLRISRGLAPSTGYTIVVPDVLRAEIDKVRQRGWARSVDETEIGMSSLAVPVRSEPGGPVVAAISMVGPTSRVAGDTEASNVASLHTAARRLTEALEVGEYRLPRRRR